MLFEKDAPYLVVLILSVAGWACNFLAENYLNNPSLQYHWQSVSGESLSKTFFIFKNISRDFTIKNIDIQIHGDNIYTPEDSCFSLKFLPPFKNSHQPKGDFEINKYVYIQENGDLFYKCASDISINDNYLNPGAEFFISVIHINNFTPTLYFVEMESEGANSALPVQALKRSSFEARVARNRDEILVFLLFTGISLIAWIYIYRWIET